VDKAGMRFVLGRLTSLRSSTHRSQVRPSLSSGGAISIYSCFNSSTASWWKCSYKNKQIQ